MTSRMESCEAFHVAEYIESEMAARGWSRNDLALRMMPDELVDPLDKDAWGITRLALDMLLELRDERDVLIGSQADDLARAFGTSRDLWVNLHNDWRNHPATVAAFAARGEVP